MPLFTPSLKKSGHLDQISITVCNVGSRKLSTQDDYGSSGWQIFAPNLTILGVDADGDACEEANEELVRRNINWQEKHLAIALAKSKGEKTLYVTKHPMCSSLYHPNEDFLNRFNNLPEFANLDFTFDLETTTLDQLCQQENIPSIDFLQIDVQGADLDVLQGGLEILSRSVLGIQIEVEFSPLYLDQPLFADIDKFLRQQSFSLFHLATSHRIRRISPIQSRRPGGQILWGEAYYYRDLIAPDLSADFLSLKTPEQILKLACIADVMDFTDYAVELLAYLTVNCGQDKNYNFADNIIEVLSQFPDLIKQGLANLEIFQILKDFLSPETENFWK